MKVLHVSDVFLRHGGGAPNVIKGLAWRQLKSGHQVMVATFAQDTDWPLKERFESLEVWRTSLKSGSLPFYISGYRNFKNLALKIKNLFRPDLLHLHMPFSGLAASSAVPGIPVVYTFHGSWAKEYMLEAGGWKRRTGVHKLEGWLMCQIERRALSKAEIITTLSEFMQQQARQYAVNPSLGWQVVPGGVDLERFKPMSRAAKVRVRGRLGLPSFEDSFFIFTVRRLVRRMGLENLIKAVKLVEREIPKIYLIIGGKGELEEDLRLKIQDLRLEDKVRLEGFIGEEDLPKYFAAADLFVLPTQALEGFGLINLEAMASGTPVLGTPVGAIPEVIGPFRKEFILKGVSPEDIASGILHFYSHYKNDENIRREAREYAENFSWERMAQEYEKLYQKVLGLSS